MVKVYEVYQCEYKDEVVYIGQGTKGRHKHCNTGISHVRELNRIYFIEGEDKLCVKVIKELSDKGAALELEKSLIDYHRPKFNKVFNSSKNPMADYGDLRAVKKQFNAYANESEINLASYEKYHDIVDEFLGYVSARDLKEGTILLYSNESYLKIGLKNMGKLSRFIRCMENKYSPKKSPTLLFYLAVKDIYNIDLKECLHTRTKTSII